MTVAELRRLLDGVPPDTPVQINYEQFAISAVDDESTGLQPDGAVFWIVASE